MRAQKGQKNPEGEMRLERGVKREGSSRLGLGVGVARAGSAWSAVAALL